MRAPCNWQKPWPSCFWPCQLGVAGRWHRECRSFWCPYAAVGHPRVHTWYYVCGICQGSQHKIHWWFIPTYLPSWHHFYHCLKLFLIVNPFTRAWLRIRKFTLWGPVFRKSPCYRSFSWSANWRVIRCEGPCKGIRLYDSRDTGQLEWHACNTNTSGSQPECWPRVAVQQQQPGLSGTRWSSFVHHQMSVVLCLQRFQWK